MKVTYTIHVDGIKVATVSCQDRRWGERLLRHIWNETVESYPLATQLKVDRLDLRQQRPRARYDVLMEGPPKRVTGTEPKFPKPGKRLIKAA